MKKILFLLLLFLGYAFAKAQSKTPDVELIEDKQRKRWLLYAQNNTDEEKEAFLLVQGQGFRRSAGKPVIKIIPANSKVLMQTLIPLKGAEPTYTKIFTFEDKLQTVNRKKNNGINVNDAVQLDPVDPSELTVFIQNDCPKCEQLVTYLNDNHVKYRLLDIDKHQDVKDLMFSQLDDGKPKTQAVLPVVCQDGKAYENIPSISRFIKEMRY